MTYFQMYESTPGHPHHTFHGVQVRQRPSVNFDVPMQPPLSRDPLSTRHVTAGSAPEDARSVMSLPDPPRMRVHSTGGNATTSVTSSDDVTPTTSVNDVALMSLSPSQDRTFIETQRQLSAESSRESPTTWSRSTPIKTPSRHNVKFDEPPASGGSGAVAHSPGGANHTLSHSPAAYTPGSGNTSFSHSPHTPSSAGWSPAHGFRGGRSPSLTSSRSAQSTSVDLGYSSRTTPSSSRTTPANDFPRSDSISNNSVFTPSSWSTGDVTTAAGRDFSVATPASAAEFDLDQSPLRLPLATRGGGVATATPERPDTLDIKPRPRPGGILKKSGVSPVHVPGGPPRSPRLRPRGVTPVDENDSSRSGASPGSTPPHIDHGRTLLDIDMEGQRTDPHLPLAARKLSRQPTITELEHEFLDG